MTAFEFFFSFYGLLLGLSVAALVSGFANVLHERQRVRFGWLTPLLAVFVAIDIATFWTQAWVIFRGAPFNPALLILGLAIAATFYVAASITFPRLTAEGVDDRIDLDAHFWAQRRLVFGCIMAANLMVGALFIALIAADPGFAVLAGPRLWIGFAVFVLGAGAAAFARLAPRRRGRPAAGAGLQSVERGPRRSRPDRGGRLVAGRLRLKVGRLPPRPRHGQTAGMMRRLVFAGLVAGLLQSCATSPAMSQNPPAALPNTQPSGQPWDRPFLPPAPEWDGASRALLREPGDRWATDFERDPERNFSPNYADTRAWFDRLDAASDLIRIEEFGVSPEGRPIYAVIASKDGGTFDPHKPVLLVQAGIHPGEIDGKDAGMMLLRDIAFYGRSDLLDRVNLILVPIFSVDGHERSGPYSRPNQRGPRIQGWRHTATNQNLNRDYMKLDQAEMRAMMGLIRRYSPDLYLDVHVTDGMDYQYDVTYGFNGENGVWSRSPATARWLDAAFKPAMNAALSERGHIPGELVFGIDDQNPRAGLSDGGLGERYSNGWGSVAHVPTILIENHSLKPYEQRVLGTYVFIETSLRLLAEGGGALRAAVAEDRAARPATIPANFRADPEPAYRRSFLGIRYETYDSPASGRTEVRWLGQADPEPWDIPFFGSRPTLELGRPEAYWIPAHRADLIERLRVHGVAMELITAPHTVPVEMLRLNEPRLAARANEGHVATTVSAITPERRDWTFAPGSVRVPTDQPLGTLVVLLLEPQSSESFFAWGMFPEILSRVEYIEGYAIAPLAEAMLAADPALKAEFEAKLAAEPEFAADGDARLQWFYRRTPFYDDRHLLYPVAREVKP